MTPINCGLYLAYRCSGIRFWEFSKERKPGQLKQAVSKPGHVNILCHWFVNLKVNCYYKTALLGWHPIKIVCKAIWKDEDETFYSRDFSFCRFEPAVIYSASISPICLPYPSAYPSENAVCITTGWGRIYNAWVSNLHGFPITLQQVSVPILVSEQCQKIMW